MELTWVSEHNLREIEFVFGELLVVQKLEQFRSPWENFRFPAGCSRLSELETKATDLLTPELGQ